MPQPDRQLGQRVDKLKTRKLVNLSSHKIVANLRERERMSIYINEKREKSNLARGWTS